MLSFLIYEYLFWLKSGETKDPSACFANLFFAAVETEILNKSTEKPLVWKRYIDDVFSLWNTNIEKNKWVHLTGPDTIQPLNSRLKYQTKKPFSWILTFTNKGDRFRNTSILDVRTHYKPTETFQYTYFPSCHTHQGSVKASSKAQH